MTAALTPVRGGVLVAGAAALVYATSLANGFACDDAWVIEQNPMVTEGRPGAVLDVPYWPQARARAGEVTPPRPEASSGRPRPAPGPPSP